MQMRTKSLECALLLPHAMYLPIGCIPSSSRNNHRGSRSSRSIGSRISIGIGRMRKQQCKAEHPLPTWALTVICDFTHKVHDCPFLEPKIVRVEVIFPG